MKIIIDYEECGGFDNRKPTYEMVKELSDMILELLYAQVEEKDTSDLEINLTGEIEIRNYQKEMDYGPKVILVKKFHKHEQLERKEIN